MYQDFRSVSCVALQGSKERFRILSGTLGTFFHPGFNLSHKNISGRDFCLKS